MYIEEFELEKFKLAHFTLWPNVGETRGTMVGSEESIEEQRTTEIKPASLTFILTPQFKKLDIWLYQRMKLLQFGRQHYTYG